MLALARNRERDARSTELAQAAGFAVIRLWECDVLATPDDHAAALRSLRDHPQSGRAR